VGDPRQIAQVTFYAVIVCWFVFGGIFLFRKRPPKTAEKRRDPVSFLGIFLQGCANGIVWFQKPGTRSSAVFPAGAVGVAFSLVTVALAICSVWLVMAAVRTLGKQWAVAARLVEGHRLVTEGPYQFVRNPIYTGLLGMLIATGFALCHWKRLILAIAVFSIGMVIRVRAEEKLLRSAFGEEFEAYVRRVPAFLPGIF